MVKTCGKCSRQFDQQRFLTIDKTGKLVRLDYCSYACASAMVAPGNLDTNE